MSSRALDVIYGLCCLIAAGAGLYALPFIAAEEGLIPAALLGLLLVGMLLLGVGFVVPGTRGLWVVGVGAAVLTPPMVLVALLCLLAPGLVVVEDPVSSGSRLPVPVSTTDARIVGLIVLGYAVAFGALAYGLLRHGGPDRLMIDRTR